VQQASTWTWFRVWHEGCGQDKRTRACHGHGQHSTRMLNWRTSELEQDSEHTGKTKCGRFLNARSTPRAQRCAMASLTLFAFGAPSNKMHSTLFDHCLTNKQIRKWSFWKNTSGEGSAKWPQSAPPQPQLCSIDGLCPLACSTAPHTASTPCEHTANTASDTWCEHGV